MSAPKFRLITIPFSHFCEKGRWALDRTDVRYREEPHMPIAHFAAVRLAGGKRTVPLLKTPHGTIADSTDLLHFCDRGLRSEQRLFPDEKPLREEVERWEQRFDERLGPSARTWAYVSLRNEKGMTERLLTQHLQGPALLAAKASLPAVVEVMRRGLRLTEERGQRAEARVREVFDEVDQALADGRKYLCGERFTAADLTFAALSNPVLRPKQLKHLLLSDEWVAPSELTKVLRASRAGKFAARLYEEERGVVGRGNVA